MLETADLLKKVRKLEIVTRKKVNDVLSGAYHSVFKGRGIEFDEVREYTLEDDVRDIDWNVSARLNAPYVKKYVEERELTVLLMVDISSSMAFGTPGRQVREQAIEAAALLGLCALKNHDRAGLVLFGEKIEKILLPRRGNHGKLQFIRELLAANASDRQRKTSLAAALSEVCSTLKKRSVIFIISDLLDDSPELTASLRIAGRRHEVIVLNVYDPIAWQLPAKLCNLYDAENHTFVRLAGRSAQQNYDLLLQSELLRRQEICRQCAIELIDLPCQADITRTLIRFFTRRKKFRSNSVKRGTV